MKLSNHILKKNLEQLEKDIWENPIGETFLITRCCELRKKKLEDFTIEDLRIMIGQSIGLQYLIPIANEKLRHNPMAKGDFFEGDLLQKVLNVDLDFWVENKQYWVELKKIIIEIDFEMFEIKPNLSKFNSSKWNKNYKP
jgi:CDI immunity proteins